MSDDVFEAFGDDDIFAEEEETEQPEGEGQNRTFIIAVAVLGGLLVCALISFGVWALVLNKPRQAAPPVTEEVATATMEAIVEETATPEPTATPSATDTPEPSPTPLLGPTATPQETGEEEGEGASMAQGAGEGEEEAEPTATTPPRRTATPTPTRTPSPTSTPRVEAGNGGTGFGESTGELSQTGLGEWLLVGAAVLFVGVMILARRLRTT
jgi:hypothetical protein